MIIRCYHLQQSDTFEYVSVQQTGKVIGMKKGVFAHATARVCSTWQFYSEVIPTV